MKRDLYVAPSKIAGKGVFTKKAFKKGQTIFILKGEKIKWVVKDQQTADTGPNWVGVGKNKWIDPAGIYQYLNHSCDPNMGIKGSVTFVALRDIQAGEEVTFDYSITEETRLWKMKNTEKLKNKKKFRRVIRSIQYLPEAVYKTYLPYVPKYFQKVYEKSKYKKL